MTEAGNSRHRHSPVALCEEGKDIYAGALRSGRIARSAAIDAPCLVDLDLLYPDPSDDQWLIPVPPSAALSQLLIPIEREIQERRRQTVTLTDVFEPFIAITADSAPTAHAITVLEGYDRINSALDRALAQCNEELLTVQPGGHRRPTSFEEALRRDRPLVDRGARMRTLYQHTARHTPTTLAYLELLGHKGQVEVRTLEEIIDRLIIVDRKVAFVPARKDRQVALELRHQGLVAYLVGVFEQFWRLATPFIEEISYDPRPDGVTGIQRSIAKLLVAGLVDEAIARRLGMNVRTCRSHIAKLSSLLGSGSRAQLGFLIARSGLLDETETPVASPPVPESRNGL
ncbi:helix-turn-helix transcriptional regulator [Streptomyces polyrhachis]|uniref:Helix-turn-helix transcriptional regulator n=1 Tax=Streptomyces polyrhachis TaxID=1282885 RepID=A0ABW2GAN4_9ACTN